MSHVTRWRRYPHPKSQRLYSKKQQNAITKIYMYYKLGQVYVTNWDSFLLLQIRAKVVTNWVRFNIEAFLLQIEAAITNYGNRYYKIGQLLQIGAKCITDWDRYYKLRQLLQTGA